jgi:large subunit ribosomal protein L15
MRYNELQVAKQRPKRRVGRGISSGQGMTAGRGTKGQNSRKSGPRRPGFEGGQTPLAQRLPKLRSLAKGSLSRSAKNAKADNIYTGQLNQFAGKTVDNYALVRAGLAVNAHTIVKVIVKGELKAKVEVHLQAASDGAINAIKAAGGNFVKTPRVAKIAKK